ncbi:MAG: DUF3703 domain-containing protein [Acidobacteriota bacterium]|nr:DUF3703 domain-containing protein [Acidobacteriota bacterium]
MNLDHYKAYDAELKAAHTFFEQGSYDACFRHLERAHILGQRYSYTHVQVHWHMLRVGLKRGDRREIRGQLVRLLLAVPGSLLRLAPKGNTGGADVGLFKKMEPPEDLKPFCRN